MKKIDEDYLKEWEQKLKERIEAEKNGAIEEDDHEDRGGVHSSKGECKEGK